MNDLSGLTHSTLRLRMRSDLFPEDRSHQDAQSLSVEPMEKCDGCGTILPLYTISFTGAKFLCCRCELA